ncbi:MAG: HPP family protein [Dehalococcoidales bacterium]|nr:HPP family protein [Dehalococcoidales bacterium]
MVIFHYEVLPHIVIATSLGGSTFIVFAMPSRAKPRRLVGGHTVGLISGSLFYFMFFTGPLAEITANGTFLKVLAYALSVGLCIILMTITDTEHTPAVATALGIVTEGWSYQIVLSILLCAISLTIFRRLLDKHLQDLV